MTIKRSSGTVLDTTSLASTTRTQIDLAGIDRVSVQVVYSDDAPAAKTFTDADINNADDEITITAHPYVTGTKVALTTDGGLPTGLSATNYWVIVVDANTIKLASSLANAVAGTAVATADDGSGTHTLTAATSAGNTAKLQVSNDGTNWTDLGSYSVTIATTAGSTTWDVGAVSARYLAVLYTPSAGQVSLAIHAGYVI